MSNRFKHKNPINKIMIWFVFILVLTIIICGLLIPGFPGPGGNSKKSSIEKVALNFAATVAQTVGTYYEETNYIGFVGIKTDYEGNTLIINDSIKIVSPEFYKCEILDSIIVVTHKEGTKAEVRWR